MAMYLSLGRNQFRRCKLQIVNKGSVDVALCMSGGRILLEGC